MNGQMLSFNEILQEQSGENTKPYRLVVIAERRMVKRAKAKKRDIPTTEKPESTSSKLYKIAREQKIDVYSCKINGAFVNREDDGSLWIHNADDDKGFEIDGDTIVIIRGAITLKDSYLDLISQLERYGIPTINSRECIEVCADKYRTYLRLQEIGMNQPKTVLIPNDEEDAVDRASEQLDFKFPMVLKTLQGSKGVGVLLVETERSLQSQVSLIYKIDPFCDILLQEFLESDYDVRVMINNKRIIGAMRRNKILDDFRSNVSQGAETQKIKLTETEQEACLQAAKAVGGDWVGVDFMPAKNRDKDDPFILEINHSPGTQGISALLKEEVTEIVIADYYDRDTWRKSAMECGVLETIEVEGDIMTAKLDTGNNTSACAIHTEDLKINGKVATWKTNGKKYKKPIIRYAELIKPAEKRAVVKLEINFLNTIYDQEVFLDSRGKIPFLANRDFMKRANVMINPSRKFLLTNKHDDGNHD